MLTPDVIKWGILCLSVLICAITALVLNYKRYVVKIVRYQTRASFYHTIIEMAAHKGATADELKTMEDIYIKYIDPFEE